MFCDNVVLTLHLEAERSLAQPALAGCMLILPLAQDDGAQKLAFGCLVSEGKVGRSPRRFAISHLRKETINVPTLMVIGGTKAQVERGMAAARPALRLVSSRD